MTRPALQITADSLSAALAKMPVMSKRAVRAVIHTGARQMVKEPWRISRVLYPWGTPGDPDCDATMFLTTEIAVCERWLEASEAQAAAGSRLYDNNRHLALRQARIALTYLRIKELVEAKRADLEAAE